jgi:UDP-N-acetylmuramate--alanine ligase
MSIFKRKKRFHFVGIGGVGMSGLAEILVNMGHKVTGSDRQKSELTDYLAGIGVEIYEGHKAEHVQDVDYLIYSSAIPMNNPEIVAAITKNIRMIRRAELLGQFMNRKFGIAVAGTHGKTSTTSMIGHILLNGGFDPTIIVGGTLKNLMTNARLGSSEYLVTEADEYDRSFLALFPRIAVITSVEADHLDIYDDLDDLKRTFVKFANQVSFDGLLMVSADDENVQQIQSQFNNTVLTYGFSDHADYRAENIQFNRNCTRFEAFYKVKSLGEFELIVPGDHNVKNALAAIGVCYELEMPVDKIYTGLKTFTGVHRRFEIKADINNILIVDDYAHHPTEVRATLKSAKTGWDSKIIAAFQPHLYTRTRDFYKEFAKALAIADICIICDVYPAREEKIPGVSGEIIARALKKNGHKNTIYIENKDDIPEQAQKLLKPGNMFISMGAGDIWKAGEKLAQMLKEN